MTEAIRAAADSLAAAKLAAESGMAALTTASAEVDKVRACISEFESQRTQIVAARKAGKTSPKHGPRLAEIEADLEGLREILSETAKSYAVVGAEFQRLQQAVVSAERALALARDQALLADMKQIASDLDRRLLDTIGEISAVAKRLGMNLSPWHPSIEMATAVRRLDLEAGALRR